MPPEMTYPTTRPHWLAETGSGAAPQGSLAGPVTPSQAAMAAWAARTPSTPVVALGTLASRATLPTANNVIAIMSAVCAFHGIPCALGLTVLDHECDARGLNHGFQHPDGMMQTTRVARIDMIPQIPRPLKLQLLELPANDRTNDATLNRRLHAEFPRRVAVQIAVGVQEIVIGLSKFNGYVALALIAYNAGASNAARIATRGRATRRLAGTTDAAWETMCRLGAAMLHQPPTAVDIARGRWLCDAQIPAWAAEIPVHDRTSRRLLVAYQYLRSVRECIRSRPTVACNATTNRQRLVGTGAVTCRASRDGALDKLYDPTRLRPVLRVATAAAAGCLQPIPQDPLPLKVENGRFVKVPPPSGALPMWRRSNPSHPPYP